MCDLRPPSGRPFWTVTKWTLLVICYGLVVLLFFEIPVVGRSIAVWRGGIIAFALAAVTYGIIRKEESIVIASTALLAFTFVSFSFL